MGWLRLMDDICIDTFINLNQLIVGGELLFTIDMKRMICSKCKEDKDISLFHPKKRAKSWYQDKCKKCHCEYMKLWYKNANYKNHNKPKRKAKVRDMIINAKNIPCKDCGKSYDWYVMDLDHIPWVKKSFALSSATSKYRSYETVQREIDKCEAICSNCHRVRTHNRWNANI